MSAKLVQSPDQQRVAAASPKSHVPPGAIPKSVNFLLGGMAG